MPRGRPMNHDRRIAAAVANLRKALVAKEQAQIELRVSAQMAGVIKGLGGPDTNNASPARTPSVTPKRRGPKKGNPKLKSKLKAYWADLSPAERAARVKKMQAGRSKK